MQVSVIIPTFNRWPTLCRAVDSVLAQTRPADEIIVVDDGSNDDTATHLRAKYGPAIQQINQQNCGVSAARNRGIELARGSWIALLDSDDEWLPQKLSTQVAMIESQPDCVLCHTDEIWIRNGVRVNQMKKHQKFGGDIFAACLPMCAISPSSVLLSKQLLNEVGHFDESLPACEDYDLWLRICAHHPVHYIDEKLLLKYGGHADQLSRKYSAMDSFRVTAMKNLIHSNALSKEQTIQTKNMLRKKIYVLKKGATKHNNASLLTKCDNLIEEFNLDVAI